VRLHGAGETVRIGGDLGRVWQTDERLACQRQVGHALRLLIDIACALVGIHQASVRFLSTTTLQIDTPEQDAVVRIVWRE
jgi:hypothetical protein